MRSADDHSVITFGMTTLHRTGHIPAAIEARHPRPFNHPSDPSRPPAVLIWEEEEEEEEEKEDNFAPAE